MRRNYSPALYPVLSFLILILFGTFLLVALPTANGTHLHLINALFMSTSATCVTGLSVMDVATRLTIWGQLTILALIQLGGLGIMTFSTVLILALGRSVSFRSRFIVQDIFAHSPQSDFTVLLRRVLIFTFSFEALGTLALFARFHTQYALPTAWYYALFNSVSAFCNAGFSLFSDSFVHYRGDVLVNLTLILLIISGGIGFMVMHDVTRARDKRHSFRQFWNQLSLHSKLVLSMTLFLLVAGTFFFLGSEWSDALKGLPFQEKLLTALFQSVTPRTAGFNTVDYSSMNNISLLGTLILMFIGASPGSTGGGIKTSTLAVLLALCRARLSGSGHVHAFKRSISAGTINRAFGIFVISVVIILLGTAGLLLTEVGNLPYQASRGQFLELLFETTSAYGTVGLSMGVTAGLSAWGKFILVLVMFTGRLGPLLIAMAIRPASGKGRFLYAEERVMIG